MITEIRLEVLHARICSMQNTVAALFELVEKIPAARPLPRTAAFSALSVGDPSRPARLICITGGKQPDPSPCT